MVKDVVFERSAQKSIEKMPANVRDTVFNKIDQLAVNPLTLRNNVTKLVGTQDSRLRVGDWRIVFRFDGDTLIVIKVAPRGKVYD